MPGQPKTLSVIAAPVTTIGRVNPMIVTTAQLYKVAYKKFAVGAYNINNLEQTMGLFRGNTQSKAPFIIQRVVVAVLAGQRHAQQVVRSRRVRL